MRFDVGSSRLNRLIRRPNLPAWVISGTGLALAGLSLWYVIVVRAYYLRQGLGDPSPVMILEIVEVALLGGFSVVLVYAGYWLARSAFDRRRLWWAGLWTLIGMMGIVALVLLANSLQFVRGEGPSDPSFVQSMLLAAGGGAVAGLLIGVSTAAETVEVERARRQRDALVFVNELLRHNVLNGMQVIAGNTRLLEVHVDEDGRRSLEAIETRSNSIVELIQNVRVLVDSVSRESGLHPVSVDEAVAGAVERAHEAAPKATVIVDVPPDVAVRADDLFEAVLLNLVANGIDHNDADSPEVRIEASVDDHLVRLAVSDNGPGIPASIREDCFEPGTQTDASVGQGLGLYLVDTLVSRYDGNVWIEDATPRGTTVVVELDRHCE